MKAELVRIGNSKGIRIPKSVIEQCGFADRVEMRIEGERLIITPARGARDGWAAAFESMAAQGDDAAIMPEDHEHSFDHGEWEW